MITSEILARLAPSTPKLKRDRFLPFLNEFLPAYGINTPLRVAAFLATATMESDYWKATHEYASGSNYDIEVNPRKAKSLGNTEPGDGKKYKGAGIFQTTGKKNFAAATRKIGTKYGVDFVQRPELLQQPQYAVESACVFWNDNKLNEFADQGLSGFFGLQGTVNRGNAEKTALDYYAKRLPLYEKARSVVGSNFNFKQDSATFPATNPAEDSPSEQSGSPAAVETSKSDQLPSNEQSPNENLNPEGGADAQTTKTQETILQKVQKVGEQIQTTTEKITSVQNSFTPISNASWFMTLTVKLGGWILLVKAFLADNWLEIVVAFGLIALAVFVYNSAKNRAVSKINK